MTGSDDRPVLPGKWRRAGGEDRVPREPHLCSIGGAVRGQLGIVERCGLGPLVPVVLLSEGTYTGWAACGVHARFLRFSWDEKGDGGG